MRIPEHLCGVYNVSIRAAGMVVEIHRGDGRGDELLTLDEIAELGEEIATWARAAYDGSVESPA